MRYQLGLGLVFAVLFSAGCNDCHPVEGHNKNQPQKQQDQKISPLQNR